MPYDTASGLRSLILGILTIVKDRGGFANKTKLLKLLYLADIESYRDQRELLTGFKWIYHLFGPWAEQYDPALSQMEVSKLIRLQQGTRPDLDTVFIQPLETVLLDKLPLSTATLLAIRESASVWANESTDQLLNYVYFHTEPMLIAKKGAPLDFSVVRGRDELQRYRRIKSNASTGALQGIRRRILEAQGKSRPSPQTFTPPSYDAAFWEGIKALDDEVA